MPAFSAALRAWRHHRYGVKKEKDFRKIAAAPTPLFAMSPSRRAATRRRRVMPADDLNDRALISTGRPFAQITPPFTIFTEFTPRVTSSRLPPALHLPAARRR